MRFWDSSAVLLLAHEAEGSRECRDLARSDPRLVVWTYTLTEVASALCRHLRNRALDDAGLAKAERRLGALAGHWVEVRPRDDASLEALRARASALLHAHPLGSADALQLAAARQVFDPPLERAFVTCDHVLARAAEKEGFHVIVPLRGGSRRK